MNCKIYIRPYTWYLIIIRSVELIVRIKKTVPGTENFSVFILYYRQDTDDKEEIVNASVIKRNQTVEDRIGVKLVLVESLGWQNGYTEKVTRSLESMSDDYDAFVAYAVTSMCLASSGFLLNLAELPHVDITKAYWGGDLTENLSYKGQYYWAGGDLSYSTINATFGWFVDNVIWGNKIEPKESKSIYDIVKDGEWTFDRMMQYIPMAKEDMNGDGEMKDNDDMFGFCANYGNASTGLYYSMKGKLSEKNKDGKIELVFDKPHATEVYSKLYKLCCDTDGVTMTKEFYPIPDIMPDYRTLFVAMSLGNLRNPWLRDVQPDNAFSVIPLPKYDEEQKDYISIVFNGVCLTAAPYTIAEDKLEAVGAALELMSSEGYRIVYPTYYESAMKSRYSRDDETAKMLDLTRNNIETDFAYMWGKYVCPTFRVDDMFTRGLINKQESMSSTIQSNFESIKIGLEGLLENLEPEPQEG